MRAVWSRGSSQVKSQPDTNARGTQAGGPGAEVTALQARSVTPSIAVKALLKHLA